MRNEQSYIEASKQDHARTEHCDVCGSEQEGIERYAPDAMGIPTPVLWDCSRCANPPTVVGVYREVKRLIRRGSLKLSWVFASKAKKARREIMRKRLAEMKARRIQA